MQFPDAKIVIFARAPVEGQVKTRLAEKIGPLAACRLHEQLLTKTVETAYHADLARVCCYTTDTEHAFFSHWKAAGIRFYQQQGDDLGQRMLHAFSEQLVNCSSVLLLGSDCPGISKLHLMDALGSLHSGNDAVVIPAEDGGYVLLGLKHAWQQVFDSIDVGTDRVLLQTLHRFRQLGINWQKQQALWDIDTPNDYDRWLKYNALRQTPGN